ncbi:hypothetical protein J3E73DRAFT_435572 [Bipolaris maydis]|nr:hypothetical protein J3E73DRAFT_435572 [Bipolaris maydis]
MGGSQPWHQVPVQNKPIPMLQHVPWLSDLIKRNKCHNFIIVEKSSSVGGTWHDNKYPGCCCDVWSMLYRLFAATWDDSKNRWRVDVNDDRIECDFLVSAVGQLNQPRYPDIPGLQTSKANPSLTVYQRSPNWVIPRLDSPISDFRRALQRYVPPVSWRIRSMMMDFRESFYDAVSDNQSPMAKDVRAACKDMMEKQIPDHYNPGCKRTQLETTKIRRITESGIELEDGTQHDHDTIVLATGFRTLEFLHPIQVTVTQNRSLSSIWNGHNSIILMIEAQSRYLNALVAAVLDARSRGKRIGLVPNPQRTKAYNDEIQQKLATSSFADPNCSSCKVDWEDFDVTSVKPVQNGNGVQAEKEGGLRASKVVFGTGKKTTKIGRVHEESYVSNTTLVLGTLGAVAAGAAAWIYRGDLAKRLGK